MQTTRLLYSKAINGLMNRFLHRSVILLFFSAIVFFSASAEVFAYSGRKPIVAISGTSIHVDGKQFFVKAVSYSLSYPGKELFDEIPFSVFENDFKNIKKAGFNTIRSYEPLPDALLDLAEKNQLYVIEGIIHVDDGTDFSSEEVLEDLKKEAVSIVRRHSDRPSILFWSLWNDAPFNWGVRGGNVVNRFGMKVVNDFLRDIYRAIKTADQSRPVTASNVLNAPGYAVGLDFIDVIGLNVYIGISDWVTGQFEEDLGKKVVARLETIAEDYKKPLYVSEMGQSDFSKIMSQEKVIPTQIRLIGRRLAGFCLFQWQDDWSKGGNVFRQVEDIETHWGLVNAYRNKKSGFSSVATAVRESPYSSFVTPQNASLEEEMLPLKHLELIDGFEYADSEALLNAYGLRKRGASRFRATVEKGVSRFARSHLRLSFTPEDFGGWLYFGRSFEAEHDWSKYEKLRFSLKSEGPAVNLSIFLIAGDGKVFRGAPVLTKNADWKDFVLDLKGLFRDFQFERKGLGHLTNSSPEVSLDHIKGIGLKVNDVPYFEQIGQTTTLRIDDLALEPKIGSQ